MRTGGSSRILRFPSPKGRSNSPKDAWLSVKDDYTRYLITQGCSRATVQTHVSNVAFYAAWCVNHQAPIISASRSHLDRYIEDQLERVARGTAMNRLLSCRSFYRYLCASRRRTTDPTEQIPVKRDKLKKRRPFSKVEMHALTAHAAGSRYSELLPMLLLMIGSGCRRAELIKMHTEDVDWARGRILIHGKGSKERWVAPGAAAMDSLRRYLDGRQGDIWHVSGHTLYKWVRELGIESSVVHAHPHRFRVSFAYYFLQQVRNLPALKEIMGHENIKTTETYATWGIEEDALEMQSQLDLASSYAEVPEPATVS